MLDLRPLTPDEESVYEWQIRVEGFGRPGQEKLKGSSVLVSRCGGVGGAAACELAAAGVGKLVVAHGGAARPSDLNRQILLTHDQLGKPRIDSIARRLRELNPRIEIVACGQNVSEENAERLVAQVDLVVDAAPLFAERFLMNREAVRQRKPLIECAMYELDLQLTTIIPGETPCLRCLYPEEPVAWKREFPVFGAVAGTAGCLAAVEAIKVLAGLGSPLAGRLLAGDLARMEFRTFTIGRDPACPECGGASAPRA